MSAREADERTRVVAEAMTWLGTPFRDQTAIKGQGVDCAMLLIRVFADTGLIAPFDPRPYPPQWHLHRDEERFLGWIAGLGVEVRRAPKAGDVMVYRVGRCFSHGALVVDGAHVIHAWYKDGRVTLSPLHDCELCFLRNGAPRPRKIFDLWQQPLLRPGHVGGHEQGCL
ncbi:MAG TPA: NlpC/P60 family protein [Rhizomicrobium sp.]